MLPSDDGRKEKEKEKFLSKINALQWCSTGVNLVNRVVSFHDGMMQVSMTSPRFCCMFEQLTSLKDKLLSQAFFSFCTGSWKLTEHLILAFKGYQAKMKSQS